VTDDYGNGLVSRAVSAPSRTPALDRLFSRYLDAQLAGDRRAALCVVIDEGLAAGHSVHELHTGVLQAAQSEIGRLWQQNRISIAEEHMATAISHVVASRLFEEATAQPRLGKRIMVACVEGEYHEFPSRLVADFLDLGGFDVLYLAANVPTEHLLAMLRDTTPDLLALSVTMSFNVGSLRNAVTRVRGAVPSLPILIGGHALAWEPGLADQAGVSTCEPDAACVVDAAKRLVGLAA
jgi:methanogenic corrinoid protein MtbC1